LNKLIFEDGYDRFYWSNRNNDKNTQTFYAVLTSLSKDEQKQIQKSKAYNPKKETIGLFQTLVVLIHLKLPETQRIIKVTNIVF